jgi:hypothetical protein
MLQRLSSLCCRAVVQAKFNYDGWNSGGGGLDGARRVRIISGSGGYLNHRVYANYSLSSTLWQVRNSVAIRGNEHYWRTSSKPSSARYM